MQCSSVGCSLAQWKIYAPGDPKLDLKEDILFLEIVYFGGSSEAAMGGGGAQRPVRRGNEPKETGARSARTRARAVKTH
jgi:hypothetical protein